MLKRLFVLLLLTFAVAQTLPNFTDPPGYPDPWPATMPAYTFGGVPATDPPGGAGGDRTTGGTNPSGFVDVIGNPSVFYTGNGRTMFFQLVLAGPPLALTGASQPFNSATWTVLMDINGDGFKDFAVMLSGIDSGGAGNVAPDDLIVMYSQARTQALNPATDTVWRQDSARHPTVRSGDGVDGEPGSSADWDRDPDPYVWDFGRTRVRQINRSLAPGSNLSSYTLEYQVPLAAFDARFLGGPQLTPTSTFGLAYATANSNNNPAQKDFVGGSGEYTFGNVTQPLPFGDLVDPSGNFYNRPSIPAITPGVCSPATLLSASVLSATEFWSGGLRSSNRRVEFQYYRDGNGDGLANDGNAWVTIGEVVMNATPTSTTYTGGTVTDNLGPWNTTWNPTGLPQGQYLIRAFATNVQGTVTDSLDTAPASPTYNPATGGATPVQGIFINTCGAPPPSVSKSASPAQTTVGAPVQFTITVTNPLSTPITVSQIQDVLPSGFTYVSTGAGTLGVPTTTPAAGATGTLSWTFSPAATVPASSSRTLVFTANAAAVAGAYSNIARAVTSEGTFQSPAIPISVGAPRLSIRKMADLLSADPGQTINYTITYANDSPVNVTGAVISDTLPAGLEFISAGQGGTFNAATRTITWNVGNLSANDGPFTVTFQGRIANPYPANAAIPLVNTATITSPQTAPASASVATFVTAPRPNLLLRKTGTASQIAPGGQVTFTLSYENVGNATATGVVLTDPIPAGFTFVSATGGGTLSGGVVTWNLGSVAAGGVGSVTVTMQATNPYTQANPQTNTATITSAQTPPVSSSFSIGVTEQAPAGICPAGTVPFIYYFKDATVNVGAGQGTQRIADLIAPTPATPGTGVSYTTLLGAAYAPAPVLRFFQDPPTASQVNFPAGTSITTDFFIDRVSGQGITILGTISIYNPTTGAITAIGSAETSFGGSQRGLFTFSVPVGGALPAGSRLLWEFNVRANTTNAQVGVLFQFGGTVANSLSGTTPATFANSRSSYCVTAPARPVLDKTVDRLTAVPGDTLVYTVQFSNTGGTPMTSSTIIDTLPAGVTFVSATLNGVAVTPTVSGQQLTFSVNSPGAPAGQINAASNGTLVITARVNQPLAAGISTLVNTATLQSAQTLAISSSATTVMRRPNTTISKAADQTLLVPGSIVTFTLNVLNSGNGTATNVVITDPLPVTPYFTYVSGSTRVNGVPVSGTVTGNTLTVTLPSLAVGATATVTFQMQVAAANVPAGETVLTNTATVRDAQTDGVRSSEVVPITITSNPILRLEKTAATSVTPLGPGGFITYTLTLRNIGASTAEGVFVSDPIPANTTFVGGTIVYNGVTQTNAIDTDVGGFNAVNNAVVYNIGNLPGGGIATMSFSVRVNSLPAGTTPITNTATVAASNAAARTASVVTQATAAPLLRIIKSALDTFPFPYATVTAPAAGATALTVDSTALVLQGARVSVGGVEAVVTGFNATQVFLDRPVNASVSTPILPIIEYNLTLSNNGTAAATDVIVSDTLPPGLTFVSATPAPTSVVGSTITWNLGTLQPGGTAAINLRVLPTQQGRFTNAATVQSAQTPPVPSNAVVSNVGQLRLDKRTTTPVVEAGGEARYVITLENPRSDTAMGVGVRDVLPLGFSYLRTESFGGNAVRTALQDPLPGTVEPIWGLWSIPGNGSLTITFIARVGATVTPGIYSNDVEANSDNIPVAPFLSAVVTADDVQVTAPPVTPADLALTKTASPEPVAPGGTLTYSLTLVNNGPGVAQDVVVTDTLPPQVTFVNCTINGAAGTCGGSGNERVITIPSLPVGATAVIILQVQVNADVPAGSVITNTATVSSATPDPDPATNTATATTTVQPPTVAQADLVLTKEADISVRAPGDPLRYTLTVTNNGPAEATNVRLEDALPPNLTFLRSIGCAEDPVGAPLCTLGTVPANSFRRVVIEAQVQADTPLGSTITNMATVSSDTPDPEPGNNTASASVIISGITLDKQACNLSRSACLTAADFSPSVDGRPGEILVYRITYSLFGAPAYDVVLQDAVPALTQVVQDAYPPDGEVLLVCSNGMSVPVNTGAVRLISVALETFCPLSPVTQPDGTTRLALLAGQSGSFEFRVVID